MCEILKKNLKSLYSSTILFILLSSIPVQSETNTSLLITEKSSISMESPKPVVTENVKASLAPSLPVESVKPIDPPVDKNLKEKLMVNGKVVYSQTCTACHQPDGKGLSGIFPPLAESDFFLSDKTRDINIVLKGLKEKIKVNGKKFNGQMPSFSFLSDESIASVLTYEQNSWGNNGGIITSEEVKKLRSKKN